MNIVCINSNLSYDLAVKTVKNFKSFKFAINLFLNQVMDLLLIFCL